MEPAAETNDWHVVTILAEHDDVEALADRLRAEWALEPVIQNWERSACPWLDVYVEGAGAADALARRLQHAYPGPRISVSACRPRDWTRFWRHHFHVRAIARRLLLVPEWEADPDVHAAGGRIPIILNPGLSFGTGDHFTTRFCLEAVEAQAPAGAARRSFLDLGTGSGVLAIAAAKLGYGPILAVDLDPVCIEQARQNAELNHAAGAIEFAACGAGDVPPRPAWDVVCANIYSDVLIELSPRLISLCRDRLILSGIREDQADAVAGAFLARGATERGRDGDGEWCGLDLAVT